MPNKLTPTLSTGSFWICCCMQHILMNNAHIRKPYHICHICKYIILKNLSKQIRKSMKHSPRQCLQKKHFGIRRTNVWIKVCHSWVMWSLASLTSLSLSFIIEENRNNACLKDLLWKLNEIKYVKILNRISGTLYMFNKCFFPFFSLPSYCKTCIKTIQKLINSWFQLNLIYIFKMLMVPWKSWSIITE